MTTVPRPRSREDVLVDPLCADLEEGAPDLLRCDECGRVQRDRHGDPSLYLIRVPGLPARLLGPICSEVEVDRYMNPS